MKATNIIWDLEDLEDVNEKIDLPNEVEIPEIVEPLKEDIAKYLLNVFGYCACVFDIKED